MASPQVIQTDSGSRNIQALLAGSQAFGEGLSSLGQAIASMRERAKKARSEDVAKDLVRRYGANALSMDGGEKRSVQERQGVYSALSAAAAQQDLAGAQVGLQMIQQIDPEIAQPMQTTDQKAVVTGALLKAIGQAMAMGTPNEQLQTIDSIPNELVSGSSEFGQRTLMDRKETVRASAVASRSSEYERTVDQLSLPPDQAVQAMDDLIAEARAAGVNNPVELAAMYHARAKIHGGADAEAKSYDMLIGAISTAKTKENPQSAPSGKDSQTEIYEWLMGKPDIANALVTMSSESAAPDKRNAAAIQFDNRVTMEVSRLLSVEDRHNRDVQTQAPIMALFSKEISLATRKRFRREMIELTKKNLPFKLLKDVEETKKASGL